jgi:hypothetical protein
MQGKGIKCKVAFYAEDAYDGKAQLQFHFVDAQIIFKTPRRQRKKGSREI